MQFSRDRGLLVTLEQMQYLLGHRRQNVFTNRRQSFFKYNMENARFWDNQLWDVLFSSWQGPPNCNPPPPNAANPGCSHTTTNSQQKANTVLHFSRDIEVPIDVMSSGARSTGPGLPGLTTQPASILPSHRTPSHTILTFRVLGGLTRLSEGNQSCSRATCKSRWQSRWLSD